MPRVIGGFFKKIDIIEFLILYLNLKSVII